MAIATTQQVAAAHADIARRRGNALVATVLRTGSVHAREVLAERAWPGHTPADLDRWARGGPQVPPEDAHIRGLLDYGRVLGLQGMTARGLPDDAARARTILETIVGTKGWGRAQTQHVELLAQLRLRDQDLTGALDLTRDRRFRADVAEALRADTMNRQGGSDWASAFTRALHEPLRLEAGDAGRRGRSAAGLPELAPFLPPEAGQRPCLDALQVEPRPAIEGSALVTVMMSAYRPGSELLTAARSVLAQTWSRLELLVIDDASGPGPDGAHTAVLDQVADLDPRVQVIRKAVNGGTYRARNTALRRARGDFAIVIDSDDWWHPQTLEYCLTPLLRQPQLLATRAQGVRVTPDLLLSRVGYRPRFVSAATVLFRLREVVGRVGFFDPTRKGADTEFVRRLEASVGPCIQDLPATTTLLRSGADTLSADEFSAGWRHSARHQYKSTYAVWHDRISAGQDTAYLDPELPRRVTEPVRWARQVHRLLAPPERYDLCLAGDWRRFGGPQRSMMEEIRGARSAGLRVAVMHLEALRFMGSADEPITPQLVDLVQAGEVDWIQPDDEAEVRVLMVRYPPILQYPPVVPRPVRAEQVLVMANQAPLEADGSDPRYVVTDVTDRTAELFPGAPVTWVPQSPAIRQLLLAQDPQVRLADWDNPGLIDLDAWSVRPPRTPGAEGRPVVIGRHSRDDRIKFPRSWAELERGYTFGPGYEVRMLGATRTVAALHERAATEAAVAAEANRKSAAQVEPPEPVPSTWKLLEHGSQDVQEFLADLDFYLYLDNTDAHESFGRTLLEAAASGVLTIAHPKHQLTFGDLFDYAEAGQAQKLIAGYVADPQAYADRVARTRAAVREWYGHDSFVTHLMSHVSAPEGDDPAAVDGSATHGDLTVETIRLRSAADAEVADEVRIEHRGVLDQALSTWLRPGLAGVSDPRWSAEAFVNSAPPGVVRVVLTRDRVTQEYALPGDDAGPQPVAASAGDR